MKADLFDNNMGNCITCKKSISKSDEKPLPKEKLNNQNDCKLENDMQINYCIEEVKTVPITMKQNDNIHKSTKTTQENIIETNSPNFELQKSIREYKWCYIINGETQFYPDDIS